MALRADWEFFFSIKTHPLSKKCLIKNVEVEIVLNEIVEYNIVESEIVESEIVEGEIVEWKRCWIWAFWRKLVKME